MSRPSANDARDRRLSAEQEIALFNAPQPQMRAIAQFSVETAGRLGEILRLTGETSMVIPPKSGVIQK